MKQKKLTLELRSIDIHRATTYTASFGDPIFAFVSPPKDGHIKAYTDLTFCRESICEYIRQDLRGVSHYGMNLNKLHMVVHRRVVKTPSRLTTNLNIFRDQVLAAQVMANTIEKNYGWPLTRIYPVKLGKDQVLTPNNAFYYVVASKRWIKAPAMLSLFTLLFRIAVTNAKHDFKNKIKNIKTLYSVLENAASGSGEHALSFFRGHGRNWPLVLDNYRSLFSDRGMDDLYCPAAGSDYFFSEGINSLCDVDSKDTELNDKFLKIVNKAGREC